MLVLEDEPLIAMMVNEWLDELDCEAVGPIASLAEALAVIPSENFDVAILDVSLKGGESFPAAEALQARGKPFAFATGRDGGSVQERFPEAAVLQKPYDYAALRAVVEAWVAAR